MTPTTSAKSAAAQKGVPSSSKSCVQEWRLRVRPEGRRRVEGTLPPEVAYRTGRAPRGKGKVGVARVPGP
eukprot:7551989-Prorocentrum_lima.AAC.1